MGEGRQGGGRARRSKPRGLARRRGRRAGLGDRKGQSRSLSHEGEDLFQVRRQRLTLTADDDKHDVKAPSCETLPPGRLRFDDVEVFDPRAACLSGPRGYGARFLPRTLPSCSKTRLCHSCVNPGLGPRDAPMINAEWATKRVWRRP
jgi:hypothetical protein